MNFRSFIRFSIAIVIAAVSVIASIQPAQAATITGATVTSSATIGTTGTNATSITVTAAAVTGAPANIFIVSLPSGWTFVTPGGGANCPSGITVTGISSISGCQALNAGSIGFAPIQSLTDFTAGQSVSVVFAPGSLNVGTARIFDLKFANSNSTPVGGATVDSGTATLAGGVSHSTVTFNANGGTGTMADQSGTSSAALSANTFSRSGYTFAGWSSSPTGSVEFGDGAQFPFTASTTLYAVWTENLASTGLDGFEYLFAGLGLGLFGITAMLISQRRRVN